MINISGLRVFLLIAAAVLTLGGSVFYVNYFLLRPTGNGPAGPAVPIEPFQSVWTDRRVHLVGIGDSITAGLGASKPGRTFFNRLIQNPTDEFDDMKGRSLLAVLPNLTSKNLAVSGSNSRQHMEMIQDRLAVQSEDLFGIVVLTTGGNDLIHSYGRSTPRECAMYGATLEQAQPWIASFRTRLAAMLDLITERFPGGCEIYLANIYDPTDGVGDAPSIYLPRWPDGLAIHAAYNGVILECVQAREHVHMVPIYEVFLGHGSHCRQFWRTTYQWQDPNYWFFSNVEDPNDRGYDAIRRTFLNVIIENSSLRPK
ncbi:SGNH/GDSL hydrolase family protein [Pirellulaceae bacterium SH449]